MISGQRSRNPGKRGRVPTLHKLGKSCHCKVLVPEPGGLSRRVAIEQPLGLSRNAWASMSEGQSSSFSKRWPLARKPHNDGSAGSYLSEAHRAESGGGTHRLLAADLAQAIAAIIVECEATYKHADRAAGLTNFDIATGRRGVTRRSTLARCPAWAGDSHHRSGGRPPPPRRP